MIQKQKPHSPLPCSSRIVHLIYIWLPRLCLRGPVCTISSKKQCRQCGVCRTQLFTNYHISRMGSLLLQAHTRQKWVGENINAINIGKHQLISPLRACPVIASFLTRARTLSIRYFVIHDAFDYPLIPTLFDASQSPKIPQKCPFLVGFLFP